jgi:hypothetical protein
MRIVRAWLALTGIVSVAVSMASVGFPFGNPVWGAVLDGFSINTQDKSVTVTLFTDQRVPYSTETQGRQFTIVLPNAQLAKSQVEDGLPVVIDNKNRFIGRAVPTDDGQVKIILPNLPADEYSVSIQQKQGAQKAGTTAMAAVTPVQPGNKPDRVATALPPSIKPRPAVLETDEQAFERVTARFQQKKSAQRSTQRNSAGSSTGLRLAPVKTVSTTGSPIWNPYVAHPQTAQEVSETSSGNAGSSVKLPAEPISTVSVADSLPHSSAHPQDPFWYLHALPPATPLPVADDMQGLAKATLLPQEVVSTDKQQSVQAAPAPVRSESELKSMLKALPKWLWIALGVFLSGLGLFGLIGAVVLLKVLFIQARPMQPAFIMADSSPVIVPPAQPMPPKTASKTSTPVSKPVYTPPPRQVLFQDTSSVNALDYLKAGTHSVSEAVQNTALLKFPHTRRMQNTGNKPKTGLQR